MKTACKAFAPEWDSEPPSHQIDGPAPLFIIGAPRTGTTLTEHILSAHPSVHPLGESLISRVATWPVRHLSPSDIATAKQTLGPSLWQMMGTAYGALASKRAGAAGFVTDKAAMLHLFVGVLAKALPAARFIWISRTPEAAALSAFRTYFTSGNAWSCRIDTALDYLSAHQSVMQDWAELLGPRLLAVSYEALVSSSDEMIPKLTEFAGLTPHEGPLTFYRSARPVDTASLAQVREPMRPARAEAWRVYESFIAKRKDTGKTP